MKLEKAIEYGRDASNILRDHGFIAYADAVKLGVEAIKLELKTRQEYLEVDWILLPGETKD